MSRDLLIIEPGYSGHRLRHVARLAAGAAARGLRTTVVVSPMGAAHPDLAGLPTGTEIVARELPQGEGRNFWRLHLQTLLANRALAKAYPARRTIVPYGENVDKAMALLGPGAGAWEILLMRTFFHHAAMGVVGASTGRDDPVREWIFRRLLARRGVRRVLTFDELLPRYARERGWRGAGKVGFVPDPAHHALPADPEDARRRWGIPEGAPTLLIYGLISPRKGIADALGAAAADPEGRLRLLIVGTQDDEARELFASREAIALRESGRLIEADRHVDEAEESVVFAAADVVWLGYRDFQGSSGVLVQAAQADRPVVGCPEGLIGWRTREHGLGAVLEGRTPVDVLDAIRAAETHRNTPQGRENRLRFARANSEQAFVSAILDDEPMS